MVNNARFWALVSLRVGIPSAATLTLMQTVSASFRNRWVINPPAIGDWLKELAVVAVSFAQFNTQRKRNKPITENLASNRGNSQSVTALKMLHAGCGFCLPMLRIEMAALQEQRSPEYSRPIFPRIGQRKSLHGRMSLPAGMKSSEVSSGETAGTPGPAATSRPICASRGVCLVADSKK
jgi:hypothetical protein